MAEDFQERVLRMLDVLAQQSVEHTRALAQQSEALTGHRRETALGFDRIDRRFERLETRVEVIEMDVRILKSDLAEFCSEMSANFNRLERRIDNHEVRIENLERS